MKKPLSPSAPQPLSRQCIDGRAICLYLVQAAAQAKIYVGVPFKVFVILFMFSFFLAPSFSNAQSSCNGCKPSGGPTYKCISGNVSDLITSGDLLPVISAQTTPQYVVIEGDLIIDMHYAFTNGSIMIALNDIEIKVNEPFQFWITDSEIRGCDYLWDGIVLENKSILQIKNSLIRDAKHAIQLDSEVDEFVSLTVVNSEFRANYVSLNLSRRKYPSSGFDNLVAIQRMDGIVSSEFFLDDLLLPDYSNQITDDYPKVGIYIKDIVEMEIGGGIFYSGVGITFKGIGPCSGLFCHDDPIQYAIDVRRTNTKIRNTKIDDIIYAVYGVGSNSFPIKRITFEGLGTSGGAQISLENVRTAFEIYRMSLIASGAKIQQGGIQSHRLMYFNSENFNAGVYYTQITNNIITNASPPTIIFNDYEVNKGLIRNNKIYVSNLGYWGEVIGSHFSSIRKNTLSIHQNRIELPSTGTQSGTYFKGIHLSNQEKAYVARNIIDGSSTRNGGNIWLTFCERIGVFMNNVTPTLELQSILNADGLWAYETRNSTYACNNASNLDVGMKFSGDCMYSDVQKNYLEDDFQGIKLTNQFNTKIGVQPDRRNRWPGTNSYSGGYEAISEGPIIEESKFYVPQSSSSDYWPDPYTPSDFFNNSSGPMGYPSLLQCKDTFYSNEPHGPVGDIDIGGNLVDPDDSIINGIYNPDSTYGASLIRDAEYQLYDKMVNYPSLISSSMASKAWYDSMEMSNLGIIYAVDQALRSIGTLLGSDEIEFHIYQDSIALMEEYIQNLHDAICIETDSFEMELLILDRDQANLELLGLNARSKDFYENWYASRMIDAFIALEDINGISPSNTWETNFTILFRIQLESIISETWPELSFNQIDSLELIADQCRYSGGVSVVRARAITMGLEGFELDEDEYCDPRATSSLIQLQADVFPLSIYPNPAASIVNIQVPDGIEKFRLVVRDMLGRKYHDYYIQGTSESIYLLSLDHMVTGMYSILLYGLDSKLYSAVLSIH